jgi:hypothetical protein
VSNELVFLLLPFVTAAALGFGFFVVFRERAAARRSWAQRRLVEPDLASPPRDPSPSPDRPWWGSPWLWLTACAVFLVLGIVVWPGLFGGTFLFLPFVWVWRPRRSRQVDPRTNGHGRTGGSGSFTAP